MSVVIEQTTLYNYTYPYTQWEHEEWKQLGIYTIGCSLQSSMGWGSFQHASYTKPQEDEWKYKEETQLTK